MFNVKEDEEEDKNKSRHLHNDTTKEEEYSNEDDNQENDSQLKKRDPMAIQEKFKKWLELKKEGISFNERLLQNREFHNPNIAIKMLEFVGGNEFGSNLPSYVYDPNDFPLDADYEAIAQGQRNKWETENASKSQTMSKVPNIAPPYVHVQTLHNRAPIARPSTAAQRHQLMMERFYSRDPKK